jgi:hypothetical protein
MRIRLDTFAYIENQSITMDKVFNASECNECVVAYPGSLNNYY